MAKMDSKNMSMSGHTMASKHHMWMYFHTTFADTVLFEFWNVESAGGMALSCLIVFLMAFAFEALKWSRILLENRSRSKRTKNVQGPPGNMQGTSLSSRYMNTLFSSSHLMQTLLFAVQVLWGYLLMLIFMTFSIWLGLAVTLGAAIGYMTFGNNSILFWEYLHEEKHQMALGGLSSSANLISRGTNQSERHGTGLPGCV